MGYTHERSSNGAEGDADGLRGALGASSVARLATGLAGVAHLTHAVAQTDVAPIVFFGAAGLVQVLIAVIASGPARLWTLAIATNAVLAGMYLAVHVGLLGLGSAPVDGFGLTVVVLELAAIAALVVAFRPGPRTTGTIDLSVLADPSRRRLLRAGTIGSAAFLAGTVLGRIAQASAAEHSHDPSPSPSGGVQHPPDDGEPGSAHPTTDAGHGAQMTVGEVDHERNGFDPTSILDDWDTGTVSILPSGQRLREYRIVAGETTVEVAPGVFFESWNYNGRVPGPTIRCQEGDRVRIEFINGSRHPHTIHFHGIHSAAMDGIPGQGAGSIPSGGRTIYEFDAFPFGAHLYHCHEFPLRRHIHKGLYGAFIIDPDPARHPDQAELARRRTLEGARQAGVREMVLVMNGFDTNYDGANEVYAANTVAFHYMKHPIVVGTEDRIRVYLVNMTEFDPINSLHLHANFFDYYDHGTTLTPTSTTIDTVMQCQAQRGILEFDFHGFEPGSYMFHAHQSEFAELGWTSFFKVVAGSTT
jgi:FtsP/CotA-like multicopper oxidase with cupredoxin domain